MKIRTVEPAVEIYCVPIVETELAVFIWIDDEIQEWIPKSQIHQDSVYSLRRRSKIIIPAFIAEDKGLI